MPKRIVLLLLISFSVVMIAACTMSKPAVAPNFRPLQALNTQAESPAGPRTITVVGEGRVSLEPDMVTLNVGAEASASTVSEAKTEVEAHFVAIVVELEQLGFAEKDIQTLHYGIHCIRDRGPVMPEGFTPELAEEFHVTNMVRVTIRYVEKAGEVLDAVVRAGANQLHGVTYSVLDRSTWQSQARALAVADAKSRAQELAELADVELGEVISVSEVVGGMPVSILADERSIGGGGVVPGELEFSTWIEVTFAVQ